MFPRVKVKARLTKQMNLRNVPKTRIITIIEGTYIKHIQLLRNRQFNSQFSEYSEYEDSIGDEDNKTATFNQDEHDRLEEYKEKF